MEFNRAKVVDETLLEFFQSWPSEPDSTPPPPPEDLVGGSGRLTGLDLLELLDSMMVSRHLDLEAREMRARGEGFYTIGSSGHEGNAMVGRLTRSTDPAFLHYRSGGFMAERYRKDPAADLVMDTVLGLAASADDPIAGGRHKVWGSAKFWVPPQTSTIASHLPKAVGAAFALERARKLRVPLPVPEDSIFVCSFGDASANHASAQTALNAASWAAFQRVPTPILFVCEDNGIGVSVRTPENWIEASMRARPGIRYIRADGLDPLKGYDRVAEAVDRCRENRMPVFLHLDVVRLLGHAGSDREWEYRTEAQMESAEAHDPLLTVSKRVLEAGLLSADQIRDRYEAIRERVAAAARSAAATRKLESAVEILAGLVREDPKGVQNCLAQPLPRERRTAVFGGESNLPEVQPRRHLALLLNFALHDLLVQYPEMILFGEDVARKGGVYHVTADLTKRFGVGRVFNTLLDETMILGMAIGAAHLGLLPVPEIQYLAYLHNAEDQIRGEASSLQYFSNGQFQNPMVVRIASWAYQRGFGGHFHNDNSIAVLRDVPGLVVAAPSRGDDAVGMLRTCIAMAKAEGRVVAFLEPIALYMTKDLHDPGDKEWLFAYPEPGEAVPFLSCRLYNEEATDLTILSWANGLYLSLRAAKSLEQDAGIQARVVDLRWLKPLNRAFLLRQAAATGRVLVVDEGRRTGGVGEEIVTLLCEEGDPSWTVRRLAGADGFIPLGEAAHHLLPTEDKIVQASIELMQCADARSQ